MMEELGLSDFKWRSAASTLKKLGLLVTHPVLHPGSGKLKGKIFEFRGWNGRIDVSVSVDEKSSKNNSLGTCEKNCNDYSNLNDSCFSQKEAQKNINDFNPKTDLLISRLSTNQPIYIPEGECREGEQNGPTKSDLLEAEMTEELALNHRRRFIKHFTGIKTFQTFADADKNRKDLAKVHHDARQLLRFNRAGAGVFLTINETDGKGRTKENITRVRAVFVDLDGAPPDKLLEANPHLMVESSPGKYHGYWFVKDFPLEAFKATQQRIAELLGGDKAVNDLPRVMRIPGFVHQKDEPFVSRIVLEHKDIEPMTYAEVVAKFPPAPVHKWTAPKHQQHAVSSDGEYRGQYGTSKGNRNHGLARFVGGMVKRQLDESHIEHEAVKWGMGCSPPMDMGEIMGVVRSVGRYR